MATRTPAPSDPGRSGETRKPFLLRIDAALWKELEAWAADELRSVNGQIEIGRASCRERVWIPV